MINRGKRKYSLQQPLLSYSLGIFCVFITNFRVCACDIFSDIFKRIFSCFKNYENLLKVYQNYEKERSLQFDFFFISLLQLSKNRSSCQINGL